MSITVAILEAVLVRLQAQMPGLAAEFFPDRPADYRLNHPVGALLISYVGSKFAESEDLDGIVQPRALRVSVTLVMRQLNGRLGAVAALDELRRVLVGYKPPHCTLKLAASDEKFLGEVAGLWQYALDLTTQTMQVEDAEYNGAPPLTEITFEDTP